MFIAGGNHTSFLFVLLQRAMRQLIDKAPLVRFGNTSSFPASVEILVPKSAVGLEIAARSSLQWTADHTGGLLIRVHFLGKDRSLRQVRGWPS